MSKRKRRRAAVRQAPATPAGGIQLARLVRKPRGRGGGAAGAVAAGCRR